MTTEQTPAVRTTAPFTTAGASTADNRIADIDPFDDTFYDIFGIVASADGISTAEGD